MARISKAEHRRILQMVDAEHRKVAEVAAEYGCTPANIYALLSKLRRDTRPSPEAETRDSNLADGADLPPSDSPASSTAAAAPALPDLFAPDLLAREPASVPSKRRGRAAAGADRVVAVTAPTDGPTPQPAAVPQPLAEPVAATPVHTATVTDLPRQGSAKKTAGMGAALAKPGVGLMMRTSEGEENLTPFRSLDDLLSAVKPILRAAARSPDAVWFSIQPVDLASLDSDAA